MSNKSKAKPEKTGKINSPKQMFLAIYMFVIVYVIGFVFVPWGMDIVVHPRLMVLAVLVFVFSVILIFNRKIEIGNVLSRPIFLFAVIYLISVYVSGFQAVNFAEWSFESARTTIFILNMVLALVLFMRSGEGLGIISKMLIISAIIHSFIAIGQWADPNFPIFPGGNKPCGMMGNRNMFSQYMFLTLPFIIYGIIKFKKAWNILGIVSFLLTIFSIMISTTRSIWLSTVIGALATIILSWKNIWSYFKTKKFKNIKVIVVGSSIILLALFAFTSSEMVIRTKDSGRFRMWTTSAKMIMDNSLTGVGAGNWKFHTGPYGLNPYSAYRYGGEVHEEKQTETTVRPHNDYLWILSETGIAGFIGYLLFLLTALFYSVSLSKKSVNRESIIIGRLFFFVLVGYSSYSFYSFPKERVEQLALLGIILATVVYTYHKEFPLSSKRKIGLVKPVLLVSVLLSILSGWVGYHRLDGSYHLAQAINARLIQRHQVVIDEINSALNPYFQNDPASIPIRMYSGLAYRELGQNEEAANEFELSMVAHPNYFPIYSSAGTAFGKLGQYEKAALYFDRAVTLAPNAKQARFGLGLSYYNMGEFRLAKEVFLQIDPELDDPKIRYCVETIDEKLKEQDNP